MLSLNQENQLKLHYGKASETYQNKICRLKFSYLLTLVLHLSHLKSKLTISIVCKTCIIHAKNL